MGEIQVELTEKEPSLAEIIARVKELNQKILEHESKYDDLMTELRTIAS